MNGPQQARRGGVWLAVLATGLLAAGLLVLPVIVISSSCVESGPCADPQEPVQYAGRLFSGDGRPLSGQIDLALRSVEDHPVKATTDRAGRFCLTLPLEPSLVLVSPHRVISDLPVDPRFAGPAGQRLLASARAGDDMHDRQPARFPILVRPQSVGVSTVVSNYSVAAWRPSRDQLPHCASLERPAPWYRYKGLATRWQAYVLLLAPPLAFVLVLVGVLVHRARRALVAAGLATLAVSILLTLVLLDIPRSHRYTPNPPSLYQKET